MLDKRKKMEYQQQEKELKYARWFWRAADTDSWQTTKLLVTLFACCLLGVAGYIACATIFSNILATVTALAIIFLMLFVSNVDIRDYIIRLLLRRRSYEHVALVTDYDQLKYYFINGRDKVLFIENGRDLTAIGLFKLKAIPLQIRGNFEKLIRSLYQQQIPLFWNYVQGPVEQGAIIQSPAISDEAREFYEGQDPHELESRIETHNGMWVGRLIFGTRRTIPASTDIESKRLLLYQQLNNDLSKITMAFQIAYPHTLLEPLKGRELVKAFSLVVTGGGVPAFF